MASNTARVSTLGPAHRARLRTSGRTPTCVASENTLVPSARQRFATSFSTTDLNQMARDILTHFVLSVTLLFAQDGARRATFFRMAIMLWFVSTALSSRTKPAAFGRSRAARNRRVKDLRSTVTMQLVETDIVATAAVASMAECLAFVQTTTQLTATDHHANMLGIHAANVDALVASALPFLVAATLAENLRHARQILARNHLLVAAATALGEGGQSAWRAWSFVTTYRTAVLVVGWSARQDFAANLPADRNRVSA